MASLNERQVHQIWKEVPSLEPRGEEMQFNFFPAEKYKLKDEIIRKNVQVFCPRGAALHLNYGLATHGDRLAVIALVCM